MRILCDKEAFGLIATLLRTFRVGQNDYPHTHHSIIFQYIRVYKSEKISLLLKTVVKQILRHMHRYKHCQVATYHNISYDDLNTVRKSA